MDQDVKGIAVLCGVILLILGGIVWLIVAMQTDADVASRNLSRAAEMFEIPRRVVFYNGITDAYMLTVEGRCSIEHDGGKRQLALTCKEGKNEFRKHHLGLSDNVTYFSQQLDAKKIDVTHTRIIFKPTAIVPYLDVRPDTNVKPDAK